uniref:Uncharacterized protein n=1 Tax=Wuchereria bancrofti TaxID=6293 RepID=A0AAF5Q499_WUCBA
MFISNLFDKYLISNESNETESEAETYASDEQMPSLLDDDDSNIHWDDDMDLNELLLRRNVTNSQAAQTRLIFLSFGFFFFFFCRIQDFTISEY